MILYHLVWTDGFIDEYPTIIKTRRLLEYFRSKGGIVGKIIENSKDLLKLVSKKNKDPLNDIVYKNFQNY